MAHMWWIDIIEPLSSALISFVAAAHGGLFMSNTAYPRTVPEGLGGLMPMFDHLVR